MKFKKSSRHSKLTGDFGEALVLYWLSRHGFECALVDHTGIDLIARRPRSGEVLGISVKTRSRTPGTEATSVAIHKSDLMKADEACRAFGCVPYIALVIDGADTVRTYILPKKHLLRLYAGNGKVISWGMTSRRIAKYEADPEIKSFELRARPGHWWK